MNSQLLFAACPVLETLAPADPVVELLLGAHCSFCSPRTELWEEDELLSTVTLLPFLLVLLETCYKYPGPDLAKAGSGELQL